MSSSHTRRADSGRSSGGGSPTGVSPEEREQILLDDLRAEIARLADAVEQQNELLAERNQFSEAER